MGLHLLADQEEGAGGARRVEGVEHGRGGVGIGSVVEGQLEAPGGGLEPLQPWEAPPARLGLAQLAEAGQPQSGRGRRALLAGAQQALAQLALLLGRRVEGGRVGQRVEAGEPEELLEQLRAAIERGAEARAARLLHQPALQQRADRRLRGHAADARDLRARDGLQVGHDRQALGLRLGQRRGARLGQQPARGPLGHRVGGQREAARHLAQHHPAKALGVVLAQPRDRLHDLALRDLGGLGQALGGHRLGREEQQRLDGAGQVVHEATSTPAVAAAGTTVIGPNGTSCSQRASPAL